VPEVVVHIDAAVLTGDAEGRCELDNGQPLAPETVRRLACDAGVVAMMEDGDGHPLAVGRRRRTPPAPLRRALASRDGGCRFPACGARRFVHAHHIQHWGHDGATEPDNLIILCSKHHRLVHEGGFSVQGTPGAWVFRTADGRRVETRPCTVEPLHGGRAEADARLGLDLDPDAGRCRWGAGENLDLDCATEGLWGLDHRPQPNQAA
jgi:hypothetical protein